MMVDKASSRIIDKKMLLEANLMPQKGEIRAKCQVIKKLNCIFDFTVI